MSKNSHLVYSTESGRITPQQEAPSPARGDGIVRLHRQTSGRKGKGVVLVKGLDMPSGEMKALAKSLKKLCGTGGAVKDGVIEIQGNQREQIKVFLEKKGFTVKIAGG